MNYQDHLRIEREEGEKRGIEKGLKQGIEKGLKQGIETGLKQGIVKGETDRTLALIRRYMHMKNCSFEDACHALLLTEEETETVRKLIREN